MALPDSIKVSGGTAKTVKTTTGDAAITLASLGNGSFRQAGTLDMGANWAQRWAIACDFELALSPTAGKTINLFASWSNATGAGKGFTSGTDEAYTGYSANASSSVKQLEFIGAHICTVEATATVQKSFVGLVFPKGRYLNLVVENDSGAAFHTTNTNQVVTLTPLEDTIED